ncbi:hypothetical protein Tco_0648535 [Tanacetum coccineum]
MEGELMEAFMERFKAKSMHMKGASKCMKPSSGERPQHGRVHQPEETYRRSGQVRIVITFNQGVKTRKQQRRTLKNCQERGNLRQGKGPNKLHGATMAANDKTKSYLKLLNKPGVLFPPLASDDGQESLIVIEVEIDSHLIHRIYVDEGSTYERGNILPLRNISLVVSLGDEEHSTIAMINFMIIRSPSPYNGIIGRPELRKIQAIPSTAHGMLKFPVQHGIVMLHSSTVIQTKCRMVAEPPAKLPPNESVAEKGVKPAYMIGVPRSIAEHRLNICEGSPLLRQKKRDRNKAIHEEVTKLVEAQIMRVVHYHSWLSDPVMLKKHDNSWRMCVDFTDLNKSFPKDFIVEKPDEDAPSTGISTEEEIPKPRTLFMDGSSCLEWSGAGLILTNPEGMELTYG